LELGKYYSGNKSRTGGFYGITFKNIGGAFSPVLLAEINKGTLLREGKTEKDIFNYLDELGYSYRNIYQEQTLSGDQYDIICEKK
jgi:hypothetical protein